MTGKYNIRIGKSLQEAWNLFLAAPEIYICVALLQFAAGMILSRVPGLGWLSWVLLGAFSLPSTALIAEATQGGRKATFACLKPLGVMAPQLIVLSLLKTTLITVGILLFFIPGAFLAVVWAFAEFICALEGKTFWESMQASRALVKGHWFPVAGLCSVVFLVVIAGFLFLGVGMLVTAPVGSIMMYAAFKDIHSQMASNVGGTVIDAEILP
jgi:hypothetical protein